MQSLFSWFKTTFQCKLSRKLHARNLIRFFILVSPSKSNTSENMCLLELVQTYSHPYDLILLCSHCCHYCCVIERMVCSIYLHIHLNSVGGVVMFTNILLFSLFKLVKNKDGLRQGYTVAFKISMK